MSFGEEWDKESANAIKAVEEAVKVFAIELFSGTITSTPVGNPALWDSPPPAGYTGGSARANWFLTFDSPSSQTTTNKDTGNATARGVTAAIANADYKGQYILTNNLPYIERLENGWSTQAPAGIVAPNVSRVNQLLPRIEAAANKKYGVE